MSARMSEPLFCITCEIGHVWHCSQKKAHTIKFFYVYLRISWITLVYAKIDHFYIFFVKIELSEKKIYKKFISFTKTTILKIYFYKWICILYILLLMRVENFIYIFSVLFEIGPHILVII